MAIGFPGYFPVVDCESKCYIPGHRFDFFLKLIRFSKETQESIYILPN